MSTQTSNRYNRALYLHKISIQITTKIKFRLKVHVGNKDVEMRREQRTDLWTPVNSLELIEESNITVAITSGHTVCGISIGKLDAQATVSYQEAMQAFWSSTNIISRSVVFDQQPATVTFTFRPSQTWEATRAAVDRLKKEMESYRNLMTSTTERRIDTALNYGVALAELNPMAKVAFGITKATFDVLKEQRKYDEMVSDLAIGVDRILPFARRTLEDVLYDETNVLEELVRRLHESILDTAAFICGYARRSQAMRTLNSAINSKDYAKIKSLNDEFNKLKEDFDRAVDVEALNIAKKNQIDRLLEQLRPVREANYQDDRGCMEGTRTAVLDEITAWAQRGIIPDTPADKASVDNIYWLYGMPGIGKTSVAHSLCQWLHKDGNLGGSFFCRRDDQNLRDPKRVLPTLVSKLAAMWGPYRTLVARALHDYPQLNPDSISGELLLKPLQSLRKHPARALVLVVDALDECGDAETRKKLLNSLIEASKSVNWLRIIVTSRPEANIQPFFTPGRGPCRNLEFDTQNDRDIRHFANQRLLSLIQSHSLPNQWPGALRFNQIIHRAGGLFIYVETIFRLLGASKDPDKPLNRVLSGKQEDGSVELYKLYSTAIALCIGQEAEEAETFRLITRAILVVATYRPLSDATIASLIGEKANVVKTWVNELGSLLYRDETQNGGIRVRHLSIFELLTGSSCPSEFHISMKQANEELSKYCLQTMNRELRFNICNLETSHLANSEIKDLPERVQANISDALQYSCLHWSSHLCSNPNPTSDDASRLLDTFLTGAEPLYWLEALSLMGKTHLASPALWRIKECNEKSGQKGCHLVDEILRFVLAFTTPISTSAPHIYLSGLPFMPHESTLRKNVQKLFPKVMDVCEGRMEQWQSCPAIWHGHTAPVTTILYSPNGRQVVSGSYDGTVRIWDAANGRHIVSGSHDKTIQIWDAETGKALGEPLRGHTDSVASVAYSPNCRHIVSGSWDKTIRIWDAETGKAVGEPLNGHTDSVHGVAYSPDGLHIVSGSRDKTIRIWDVETGKTVGEPLRGHTGSVDSVTYSPNGQHIVSGSQDTTIRIWNAATGTVVGEPLSGHTTWVNSVAYSPNGRHIVSGSADQIQLWDAETGMAAGEPLSGHTDSVNSVAYSPNGRHVISGSEDQTIRIWDAETGLAVGESLSGHTDSVHSVAYSPNGRHIVSGSADHTVRIWDAETGRAVGEPLNGHTDSVHGVAYSPDGLHIVSGSRDTTIRIWDAETGRPVGAPLIGHGDLVTSVAYSPDGSHIVSGSWDCTIRIWDAETRTAVGEPLFRHEGPVTPVTSVAYSPSGRCIISVSVDKTIRLWDAETGKPVGRPLSIPTDSINIAYSPDDRHFVSGSRDKAIQIWDLETMKPVGRPLIGHTDRVTSVAYSPNGLHIVSGSLDQTIRIWDVERGMAVNNPSRSYTDSVTGAACWPNGPHIFSGSSDNTIQSCSELDDLAKGDHLPNINTASEHLIQSSNAGFGISKDLIDPNGWVRCADGILFWVPGDCRSGLASTASVTIPNAGHHRRVRIDLSDFRCGHSWTDVYGGVQ